mgnify:CR=1 FL=1
MALPKTLLCHGVVDIAAAAAPIVVVEAIKLIADHKAHMETVPTHGELEDISTRDEKLLGVVVGERDSVVLRVSVGEIKGNTLSAAAF